MTRTKIFLLIAVGGLVLFGVGQCMMAVSNRMAQPAPSPTPRVVVIPDPMPTAGETYTQPHTGWKPVP